MGNYRQLRPKEINVEQLPPTEVAPAALDQAAAPPAAERADSQAETDGAAVGNEAPVGSPPPAWPRAALAWLGTIDLAEEFCSQLPTIRTAPRFLAAGVRRCLIRCLNDLSLPGKRRGNCSCWPRACCWHDAVARGSSCCGKPGLEHQPVANATCPALTQPCLRRLAKGLGKAS